MQYQERINISQQPQGEVRHHQRREDSHQRQRRLYIRLQRSHQRQVTTPTEEPSKTEDCVGVSCVPEHWYCNSCLVIVNKVVIGIIILVSDSLLFHYC